ncbi:MAG: glycosyltransferase [Dysgonamonadaceae bacterium]|nr:glycosyltransferase [Dysgonamonadaceae bacterium]MDD3901589.1 glycosyltransferase [Dysgonamonadaceae bacterium]MDD4400082.1 glycosyltransferase [Dysgonamonadaceae bacterium]
MIGQFNDCFPPIMDGVSLTTQNYAYWLNKKRGNLCVVTPHSPFDDDVAEYPVYRYLSIPIPLRKPYRMGFPSIDLSFHKEIKKISFELVHAHCPFSSGKLALKIAKEQKTPFVATFHSKYRSDFENIIHYKPLVDKLINQIIDFYNCADEVWIPQPAVEETLRMYGYKGKIEIVENGNDFSESEYSQSIKQSTRTELNIKEDEFVLLFVGQHIWEKNVGFIAEALSLIKDLPFRMFFIGSGYAQNDLKELINKLNLSSKVTFVGSITDRAILKRYYIVADLFLFPSLYDNAPLVVREAAALHTPSMLIAGSTASEIITDSENGFLISNSIENFADKIRSLYYSPEVIQQVGDNAALTINRSWKDIVNEVSDRYDRLIKRKNCG